MNLYSRNVLPRNVLPRVLVSIVFGLLSFAAAAAPSPPHFDNKFGIGCYDDTTGSPPLDVQLDAAAALVGDQGIVILYLCAWRTHDGRSCLNESTPKADPLERGKLSAAYARNLTVVARIGNPYVVRDHSDPVRRGDIGDVVARNRTSYKILASAYARFIASLPLPPRDSSSFLYVTVGNEFNACNEWRCASDDDSGSNSSDNYSNMTVESMAREVAGFYRDVSDALAPLRASSRGRLLYAHGALAPWTPGSACECGTGSALGNGRVGRRFLVNMLSYAPTLFAAPSRVDWLSSHSYPFSGAGWGNPKAFHGLEWYKNESDAISGARRVLGKPAEALPVIITETGWRRDAARGVLGAERANWTALAFDRIWLRDTQVVGVAPFLLAGGALWQDLGWPWMNVSAGGELVPNPVFSRVRRLRCKYFPSASC